MYSPLLVIFTVLFIGSQTKVVLSENNCYTNFDIRFYDNLQNVNRSSVPKKLPHAQHLAYNDVAHAFLSSGYLALKLLQPECREEICTMAKYGAPLSGNDINDLAYTTLHNMPYGLRLLLCSDVIIRSIAVNEEMFAEAKQGYKIETTKSQSDENGIFKWRFEIVDNDMNSLVFRIRHVNTNRYLVAERKRTSISKTFRRIVLTDSVKSDMWELKMIQEFNGNFNRFMIMNVPLGEYLYAARGFCFDQSIKVSDCPTRPSFTWEYETFKEAESDEYNRFMIDEYTFD